MRERGLANFNVLKKQSPRHGGNGLKNKTESKNSWTFHNISPPRLGLWFFQNTKTGKSHSLTSWIFSGPGFWILRVSKGSLHGVSPDQILSKCWGWSNLILIYDLVEILKNLFLRSRWRYWRYTVPGAVQLQSVGCKWSNCHLSSSRTKDNSGRASPLKLRSMFQHTWKPKISRIKLKRWLCCWRTYGAPGPGWGGGGQEDDRIDGGAAGGQILENNVPAHLKTKDIKN